MIVVTTDQVPGRRVLGVLGRVLGMTTKPKVPAQAEPIREELATWRMDAVENMEQAAAGRGANAVLAVRFDHRDVGESWVELCAYGTAVVLSANMVEGKRKDTTMPQEAWSAKRERQYEHIKEGVRKRGESEDVAEEIAARTVNKERARSGEAKESSRLSTQDISSSRRGGLRSHKGSGGRTRDQLYEEAKKRNIKGRSTMSKAELERAVGR